MGILSKGKFRSGNALHLRSKRLQAWFVAIKRNTLDK